jgi:hypothetical protein
MGPAQDLFGQLWKEYALSDSRYLTSDPFVLCMETVTAVCLPSLASPHQLSIVHFPTTFHTSQISDKSLTTPNTVYLGPHLPPPPLPYHELASTAPPTSNHRLRRPNLRADPILRNQHVRPLLQGGYVFSPGVSVFLGVLLLHEFHLDGVPWE